MRKNYLMPVIHVSDAEQAIRNAKISFNNGADGVFLINHDITAPQLRHIFSAVVRVFSPKHFIGMNFLDLDPLQVPDFIARHHAWSASAIWLDDPGFAEEERDEHKQAAVPNEVKRRLLRLSYHGLLFGGVAFKYRRRVLDLAHVTRVMAGIVDIVTTSGSETGKPPSIEKIETMREAASEMKLAIASGITPENVEPFLDHVDYFLVATGISRSETELDPRRVRLLADKMR
jgi:uncharacterized protein